MVIPNAVLLEIALVTAGGDHSAIARRDYAGNGVRIHGIPQPDAPGFSVGLAAERMHVAAQRQQGALDTVRLQ